MSLANLWHVINNNITILLSPLPPRRSRKLQSNQQKSPLPIGGLPVNCCGPTGSPGPLGSIATLSAFNNHKVSSVANSQQQKEEEQEEEEANGSN